MSSQASAVTVPASNAGDVVTDTHSMQVVGGRYEASPDSVADNAVRSISITANGKVKVDDAAILAELAVIDGHVDGVEALLTTIDGHVDQIEGYVDGIETLIGTTNTTLTTIDGHVDGIETLLTATNAKDFATETTLAAASGKLPATIGQKAMAASLAVTVASDQSMSTGYIRSATGSLTAAAQTVQIACAGAASIAIQLSGTFSATMIWETSSDSGTTWSTVYGWDQGNTAFSSGGTVSGRYYTVPAYGTHVRARVSAWVSGTVVVTMVAGLAPTTAAYVSPVAFFPVQGSVALAATGTGAQPLQVGGLFQTTPTTLTNGQQAALQHDASQNLLVNVKAQTGSAGVANVPIQVTYSGANITTAAYTQLVASTTSITQMIDIFDSSGQAMILATGAAASEVVLAYIPPGGARIQVTIAASTRIAYKALTATASTGILLVNFWK